MNSFRSIPFWLSFILLFFSILSGQEKISQPAVINSASGETGTSHTISTKVEVTETAINRFLQSQYNNNDIPQSVSGTIGGVTYTLNLVLPRISLLQDAMKLRMEINIVSNIGNFPVVIEPAVNLPSWSISLTEIKTTLSNLSTVVNALTIDSRLKTAIINAYNSLNLIMYPSQIVKQANTDLFKQQSIRFADPVFSVQMKVVPGILRFTLSTHVSSFTPAFKTSIDYLSDGNNYIGFSATLAVKVKEIIINIPGSPNVYRTTPNWVVPKWQQSGDYAYINIGDQGYRLGHSCVVKVRFETDNTWFSRTYQSVPVNLGWVSATSSIN